MHLLDIYWGLTICQDFMVEIKKKEKEMRGYIMRGGGSKHTDK